MFYTQANLG